MGWRSRHADAAEVAPEVARRPTWKGSTMRKHHRSSGHSDDAVKVVGDLLAVGVLRSLRTPERFTGFPACRRGPRLWQVALRRWEHKSTLVTFVECALRLVELARKFPPLSGAARS